MNNQLIEKMTSVLLLLFPATLMTVSDGGSVILVLLLLVSSISLLLGNNSIPLSKNEKHLLAIISVYILVYIFNVWFFNSKISELDNTSRFLLLLPIFFYLRKLKINPDYIYYGILLGAIASFTIAAYQTYYLDIFRPYGVTKAVAFGGLSITLAIMCLFIGSLSTERRSKVLFYSGAIMATWASILSASRGTWLAVLPCLLIWLIINPKKSSIKTRVITALISLLIIIVSYNLPIVKYRVDQAIIEVNNYTTNSVANTSLGIRLEAWRASIIIIKDNFALGIGEGNFRSGIQMLSDKGIVNPTVFAPLEHAHNEYISALLHRGILGVLSLLLLLLIPLIVFSKALITEKTDRKILPAIGVTLIVTTMTFSLSDIYFAQHHYTIFYVAFIYILYATMSPHSTNIIKET